MDVAHPKAAYGGGLEDVNEWMSKDFSQMFAVYPQGKAKQVSGVLAIPEFTASQTPEVEA